MNKRLGWSLLRYILSLMLLLVVSLAIFLWWALGSTLPQRSMLPLADVTNGTKQAPPNYLQVASYNIGHGQGVKEKAWDYRDKEATLHSLSLVADAIAKIDADIFLLQEVDLDSHRTFRLNQIEFIKEKSKHPYHACATVWEKNYVPFPYWPLAHHLGYVRAANCILSKFPLSHHERIIFDKPASNPFWYNWGYLDRAIERVDVTIGEEKIAVLNVHLEAWEKKEREKQIEKTYEYMKEINLPIIIGGDFNTIPPDALKQDGFLDDPDAHYHKENTLLWFFKNVQGIKIPHLNAPENTPFQLFTFPSNNPNRRLDHIFLIGNNLSFVDFRIAYEASTASDHLPVVAKIKYKTQL